MFFLQIYVLPPLNRPRPFWYHENYTTVAQNFAKVFAHLSTRMFILAPFECPPNRWEPDGTHLTPGEGERQDPPFSTPILYFPVPSFGAGLKRVHFRSLPCKEGQC